MYFMRIFTNTHNSERGKALLPAKKKRAPINPNDKSKFSPFTLKAPQIAEETVN